MHLKNCPTDGASLVEINKNGVMIDVCPECKGIWLDRGELDKIVQVTRNLEAEFGGSLARPPARDWQPVPEDRYDSSKYRDPRRTKDSDEWEDDHRRKKKSGLGRLLDIFD